MRNPFINLFIECCRLHLYSHLITWSFFTKHTLKYISMHQVETYTQPTRGCLGNLVNWNGYLCSFYKQKLHRKVVPLLRISNGIQVWNVNICGASHYLKRQTNKQTRDFILKMLALEPTHRHTSRTNQHIRIFFFCPVKGAQYT